MASVGQLVHGESDPEVVPKNLRHRGILKFERFGETWRAIGKLNNIAPRATTRAKALSAAGGEIFAVTNRSIQRSRSEIWLSISPTKRLHVVRAESPSIHGNYGYWLVSQTGTCRTTNYATRLSRRCPLPLAFRTIA